MHLVKALQCSTVITMLTHTLVTTLTIYNMTNQYYLLMMEGDKVFKTKDLSKQLGVSRLSFAGPEDMVELLGVHPGSVTVLGLMNDRENKVQLVMDKSIFESEEIGCHPCVSTASLRLHMKDILEKFLPATGHDVRVVDLPIIEEE